MYWERFSIAVAGVLITMCGWMYVQHDERIDILEDRVQTLQVEKVNRQELKEMEDRMGKRIDGMKDDIVSRLDWYLAGRKSIKE